MINFKICHPELKLLKCIHFKLIIQSSHVYVKIKLRNLVSYTNLDNKMLRIFGTIKK